MGFEPGTNVAGGSWPGWGVTHNAIDYIAENGYGGVMVWALNGKPTGKNSDLLGKYAKTKFGN